MRIKFLGTGAAEGIPSMGCECTHCTRARQEGGKLVRERSAILFSLPGYKLLVDTPPNIRAMLAKNEVTQLDGIFLTHEHYDHTSGIEEFLYWRKDVDLFAEKRVYNRIARADWGEGLSDVAFYLPYRPGVVVRFDGFFITPFAVHHSAPCFGLAIYEGEQKIVYTSDGDSRFPNHTRCLMRGAHLLIVNTPFFVNPPGEAHLGVDEAIGLKEEMGAEKLILTHINHFNRPHDELQEYVSQFEGVTVAYDGMEVET